MLVSGADQKMRRQERSCRFQVDLNIRFGKFRVLLQIVKAVDLRVFVSSGPRPQGGGF